MVRRCGMDEPGHNRRGRVVLATIAVVVILLIASVALWEYVLRPRSIREVLAMPFWKAGTTVDVEGTISGISRLNTTYGPVVVLNLDGFEGCMGAVFGDPAASYVVGQRFRTTLHFAAYRINGDAAVTAPELPCPLPIAFLTLAANQVMMFSQGFGLFFVLFSSDPDGWTEFYVQTKNGDAYPLGAFPVALWKRGPRANDTNPLVIDMASEWKDEFDTEMWRWSSNYSAHSTEIDSMASLADPASRTGRIRFTDADGNGRLNDGDGIQVRLDPTGENAFDSYILDLGAFSWVDPLYRGRYILNGPRGPYDLPAIELTFAQLRHVSDRVDGTVNTTLEVARLHGTPIPFAMCTFELQTADIRIQRANGTLTEDPVVLPENRTIDYDDLDADGLLDAGDRFVVGGLQNQSSASFGLRCRQGAFGDIRWQPGYGYVALPLPPVKLTPGPGPPYDIAVRVAYPHPEFAMNRTVRVSLKEYDTMMFHEHVVLDHVPLVNGTIGTFANGNLSFTDSDGDGTLSSGDHFELQGERAFSYTIWVSCLFGSSSWSAYIPGQPI